MNESVEVSQSDSRNCEPNICPNRLGRATTEYEEAVPAMDSYFRFVS